jgi:hypothetical protein
VIRPNRIAAAVRLVQILVRGVVWSRNGHVAKGNYSREASAGLSTDPP